MPFHISLLSDADNTMYSVGFLVATAATGIVNSSIDFSTGMVNVVEYVDVAKEDIVECMNAHTLEKPLQELRNKIEVYFCNKNRHM